MQGYSDRINHAFAFAAKHRTRPAVAGPGMDYLAHPSSVAVMLTGYGCEEATVVAGILHHVLEHARPAVRPELEQKIGAKFGPVVLAVACDAVEPGLAGAEPWRPSKTEYLVHLAGAEPRALDICVADEIHACGSTMSALGRYGREYQRSVSRASADDMLWWYRSLLEQLSGRPDWQRPAMLADLRRMSAQLVKALRSGDHDI